MDSARNEGKHGHKTRGEAMDPANPVLSAVASQVQAPSGEPLVGYESIGKDGVAARGESPACVGPGVKTYKHTIPNGAPVTLTSDRGYEAAEASQLADRSKSMQEPIGFRPDLAEVIGISQPLGRRPDLCDPLAVSEFIGFRPDLAEPVVTSQPIGFRPDLAEPVVTSQPMGCRPDLAEPVVTSQFRPDLSVSTVVSQPMGSRFRHLEPSFGEHGVGFPIHVELRESTSGESLREECIVDAPQSHGE